MTSAFSLSNALLSGNFDELPEDQLFLFSRCGVLHVFTAAGFHLAAATKLADGLAWGPKKLLPEGRARDWASLAARLGLMIWLAVLTGWSGPMVRAFVLVTLRAAARLLEWETDRAWLFVLSLLAYALLGRGALFPFFLSAAALAGALFFRKGPARLLAPWLCTLPVLAWGNGMVCLLGPLWALTFGCAVNVGALPLAIAGALATSCGLPGAYLSGAAETLLVFLTALLERAEALTGGAVWIRPLPWAFLTFALLMAFSLSRRPRTRLALCSLALTAAFAWPEPAFSVLDVGQGDGILLHAAGKYLLEDVGPPSLSSRSAPICQSLEKLGIGPLDNVMLSHFDLDHRGGLDSLLARHRVRGALWFREDDLNEKSADKVLLAAERAQVPIRFVNDHYAPPGLECHLAPFFEGNDSCPLCRASLDGGGAVLLTGDMSVKAEEWFVRALEPFPRAELLKVAHHGSKTSSSPSFLAATGAQEAYVSVGAHNRYHHPTPETLERLAGAGMTVRRTDKEGTLNKFYFSFFTLESIRPPPPLAISRVYPGSPASARRL